MPETPVKSLSIVIPIFNEQACLPDLFARLLPVLETCGHPWEIIFADDGSKDASPKMLADFAAQHPGRVRIIHFNRNYGQHAAIIAGMKLSRGDIVMTIDADLQNPPEEIPKLLEPFDHGADVVGTWRVGRQDTVGRKVGSACARWLVRKVTGLQLRDQGCMMRAYGRRVVEAMCAARVNRPYIPALALMYAGNPVEVPIAHAERSAGQSKYVLRSLVRLVWNIVTTLAVNPLRPFSYLGAMVCFISAVLGMYWFGRHAYTVFSSGLNAQDTQIYWTETLFAAVIFTSGLLMMGFGMIGEIIVRMDVQSTDRPPYIIDRILGTPPPAEFSHVVPLAASAVQPAVLLHGNAPAAIPAVPSVSVVPADGSGSVAAPPPSPSTP
ncbi:MAG: glycosyltransferase [Planctomycetota bacterium]